MAAWEEVRTREGLASPIALEPAFGTADRLARAVSITCAPPLMVVPLVLLVVRGAPDHPGLTGSVLAFVTAAAILPSLFVYALYLSGAVRSVDLTRRSERLWPALFATICATAAYPLLRGLGAPPVLLDLDAGLAVQLALLALITFWWKVSYHAAGAAGPALLAFLLEGAAPALPLAALAILVGWARIRLGRHTTGQVAAGWLSALPLLWWTWSA